VVRELEEQTGATIEIEEEAGYGIVRIASADSEALAAARDRVMAIVFPPEAEMGKEYQGEVVNITKFGAFVNILPGRDGLLHISKIDSSRRVDRVEDYLELGQKIAVVVEEIDRNGKLALKLAQPLEGGPSEGAGERSNGEDRPRDRDDRPRDRDDRPRDRDRGDRNRGGASRDQRPRERDSRDRDTRDRDSRDRDRSDRPRESRSDSLAAPDTGGERRRAAVSFEETFDDRRKD
jgi:polyribonucleotide nucleotidyltransferase